MNRSVSGITQRNKRSIQEIEQQRSQSSGGKDGAGDNRSKRPSSNQRPPRDRGSEKAATFGIWFVSVVGILFLFFLLSVAFAKTTVTVYPKTADISLDNTFTASNDVEIPGVAYTVVDAAASVELSASSTGSEYREAVAAGQITIYNNYSTESIRLVPNTRFQTESGLIYRTDQSVTVPGQASDGAAGTVATTVYADEVGDEYNIQATELSIPGFAGTDYEDAVYADTNGITGGVAGEVPVIASSTRSALEKEAATTLEEQLVRDLSDGLPNGFVMYDDGRFFTTSITDSETVATSSSSVTVTGKMQAVAFDGNQLSQFLATAYSDDISDEDEILISDLDQFDFLIEDKDSFNPGIDQSFEFSLSGNSQIVWQYDQRTLVRDLRGLQKDQLDDVLVNYPGVESAEVVTRPFWKRTLPAEAAEITINTVIR